MARNRPCVVMAWAAFVLPLTLIGADADEQEDREVIRARNDTWKWKSVIVGFETFRELRPAPQADEEAE